MPSSPFLLSHFSRCQEHENIEKTVMKRFENILGDRVAAISIGGAPTSQEVLRFLKKCFSNVMFSEGYGTTEVGGIASNGMRQADVCE
jgi:long-subunit acyl-CoA synthetase (AMP-forming)